MNEIFQNRRVVWTVLALLIVVLGIGVWLGRVMSSSGHIPIPEAAQPLPMPSVSVPAPVPIVVAPLPRPAVKAVPVAAKAKVSPPVAQPAPVPVPAQPPAAALPAISNAGKPLRQQVLPFMVMPPTAPPGVVAKIGKGEITEADLSDYSASEGCYGPDAVNSRKAAFMRMLEATVTEELLAREAGIVVSADDYQKELDRIDQGTRAPDVLDCIKKHFLFERAKGFPPEGRRRYERVYLRKYAQGPKFSDFMNTDQVQGDVYKTRERVMAKALEGVSFVDLAKEFDLNYSSHTYTPEEPKEDKKEKEGPMAPFMRWSPFEKEFIDKHLKALFPGQVKPAPIDEGGDFQFVKLISNAQNKYFFESLTLRRKTSEQYFDDRPRLPARIYDDELKNWLNGMPNHPMRKILQLD